MSPEERTRRTAELIERWPFPALMGTFVPGTRFGFCRLVGDGDPFEADREILAYERRLLGEGDGPR